MNNEEYTGFGWWVVLLLMLLFGFTVVGVFCFGL